MASKTFTITSIVGLEKAVNYIISLIQENHVFVFNGVMGAGKTTLINAICKKLAIYEAPSSPTYSIVNTYFSDRQKEIYHFDFYRIKDENEAIESGLDEFLYSGKICFIEWAEKVTKLLPKKYVQVGIEIISPTERKITIDHT